MTILHGKFEVARVENTCVYTSFFLYGFCLKKGLSFLKGRI